MTVQILSGNLRCEQDIPFNRSELSYDSRYFIYILDGYEVRPYVDEQGQKKWLCYFIFGCKQRSSVNILDEGWILKEKTVVTDKVTFTVRGEKLRGFELVGLDSSDHAAGWGPFTHRPPHPDFVPMYRHALEKEVMCKHWHKMSGIRGYIG